MLDITELNGLEERHDNQKILVLFYAAPVGLSLTMYTEDDVIKSGSGPFATLAAVVTSWLT